MNELEFRNLIDSVIRLTLSNQVDDFFSYKYSTLPGQSSHLTSSTSVT